MIDPLQTGGIEPSNGVSPYSADPVSDGASGTTSADGAASLPGDVQSSNRYDAPSLGWHAQLADIAQQQGSLTPESQIDLSPFLALLEQHNPDRQEDPFDRDFRNFFNNTENTNGSS